MLYRTLCTAIIVLTTSTLCHALESIDSSCPQLKNTELLSIFANGSMLSGKYTLKPGLNSPRIDKIFQETIKRSRGKAKSPAERIKSKLRFADGTASELFDVKRDKVVLVSEKKASDISSVCRYRVKNKRGEVKFGVENDIEILAQITSPPSETAQKPRLVEKRCPQRFSNKKLLKLAEGFDWASGQSTPVRIHAYGDHQFALTLPETGDARLDLKLPEGSRKFNVQTDRVILISEEILSRKEDICKYRVRDKAGELRYKDTLSIIVTN